MQARKRIFIGDVQGCATELQSLLERLRYDPQRHELWFTGDLVNRGPDSARALRTVIAAGARSVLGNHDLHLLRAAAGTRNLRPDDTFADILRATDGEQLVRWLRQQPLVQEWDDLILVHAGLHPHWADPVGVARPLEARIRRGTVPWQDPALRFFVQARHCDPDGKRPRNDISPPLPYRPWDHYYRGAKRVVFGHWAARGLVHTEKVRGIDSGCVWGGRLSAWIAEEDRLVSVEAQQPYQTPGRD